MLYRVNCYAVYAHATSKSKICLLQIYACQASLGMLTGCAKPPKRGALHTHTQAKPPKRGALLACFTGCCFAAPLSVCCFAAHTVVANMLRIFA